MRLDEGPTFRRWAPLALDSIAWTVSVPAALAVRLDSLPAPEILGVAIICGLVAAASNAVVGLGIRLYRGGYVIGTLDEALAIGACVSIVTVVGTLLVLSLSLLPRSTFLIAGLIAGAAMVGGRLAWRLSTHRKGGLTSQVPTLIYGAGEVGWSLAELMRSDCTQAYRPIGLIDDDPAKRHLRRNGLKVLGSSSDLTEIAVRHQVSTVVMCLGHVSSQRLLEVHRLCSDVGLQVRAISHVSERRDERLELAYIEELSDEELLGRRAVVIDRGQISHFIAGKRVLITGAGGSIGSELARQVHAFGPQGLLLLDRDESALHSLQLSLDGSGTLSSEGLLLADIRDSEHISRVFASCRPDVVFHAAALKHLPLLERFPDEARKTNVVGTRNVLEAAVGSGVRTFVNISTDKAADPISVLGRTKLQTEMAVAEFAANHDGRFVSVRFGNVLGSRGSVLDTFRRQINNGGPVTVTDPRVTRFFMTIAEAVQLVLQAAVIGRSGETLILDMGDPVRIVDVARYLIRRSGVSLDVEFTGLRSGEKLHETLVATGESVEFPFHPLIGHTRVLAANQPMLEQGAGSFRDSPS